MKPFDLKEAIEILERTPLLLEQLLIGLSESWLRNNEGDGSWEKIPSCRI